LNLKGFLETYPSILFSADGDHRFETLRLLTRGHSSARQAKLLHHAATFLADTELYLEIGTYTGFTLCSAGLESAKKFVGIDNFSEQFTSATNTMQELKNNVQRYIRNYRFENKDFRNVQMERFDAAGERIGVFYVDGKHDYENVVDSVKWAEPHFSDDALIMFDDLNVDGVRKGVDRVLEDSQYEEIFRARSFFDSGPSRGMMTDPYIHNGFSLVTYRGKDGLQ